MARTNKKARKNCGLFLFGALERIRTSDHLVRSQVLYPTELRARCCFGTVAEVAYIREGSFWSQEGKRNFYLAFHF